MTAEGGKFVWREGELFQRTTEEVLEDRPRRCDACRNILTREELHWEGEL